jgi:hypothetical protein
MYISSKGDDPTLADVVVVVEPKWAHNIFDYRDKCKAAAR